MEAQQFNLGQLMTIQNPRKRDDENVARFKL